MNEDILREYTEEVTIRDAPYVITVRPLEMAFCLSLERVDTFEQWSNLYDSKWVENMTDGSGSRKKYSVFMGILRGAVRSQKEISGITDPEKLQQKSSLVALDIVRVKDLEEMRKNKLLENIKDIKKTNILNREIHILDEAISRSKDCRRAFLTVIYHTEYEHVVYALPLRYIDLSLNAITFTRNLYNKDGVCLYNNPVSPDDDRSTDDTMREAKITAFGKCINKFYLEDFLRSVAELRTKYIESRSSAVKREEKMAAEIALLKEQLRDVKKENSAIITEKNELKSMVAQLNNTIINIEKTKVETEQKLHALRSTISSGIEKELLNRYSRSSSAANNNNNNNNNNTTSKRSASPRASNSNKSDINNSSINRNNIGNPFSGSKKNMDTNYNITGGNRYQNRQGSSLPVSRSHSMQTSELSFESEAGSMLGEKSTRRRIPAVARAQASPTPTYHTRSRGNESRGRHYDYDINGRLIASSAVEVSPTINTKSRSVHHSLNNSAASSRSSSFTRDDRNDRESKNGDLSQYSFMSFLSENGEKHYKKIKRIKKRKVPTTIDLTESTESTNGQALINKYLGDTAKSRREYLSDFEQASRNSHAKTLISSMRKPTATISSVKNSNNYIRVNTSSGVSDGSEIRTNRSGGRDKEKVLFADSGNRLPYISGKIQTSPNMRSSGVNEFNVNNSSRREVRSPSNDSFRQERTSRSGTTTDHVRIVKKKRTRSSMEKGSRSGSIDCADIDDRQSGDSELAKLAEGIHKLTEITKRILN